MNNLGQAGYGSTNQMEANDDADTQLADDFIVDAGSGGWNIDKVEVKGSPGPPLSGVTVFFYSDAAGLPSDAATVTRTVIPSSGLSNPNFVIPLDPPVALAPGTYWLSVQANSSQPTTSSWTWQTRTVQVQQHLGLPQPRATSTRRVARPGRLRTSAFRRAQTSRERRS